MTVQAASPPALSFPPTPTAVAVPKMDYFVSIENTRYHRWQLNLMLESMRRLGIEDNLLVAWAENPNEKAEDLPCRNFQHDDIGFKMRYTPVNKPYAMTNAIAKKLIKPPFCVIDPDMVFVRPIPQKKAAIASQYCWHMTLEYFHDINWHFLEDLHMEMAQPHWKPIGYVYQFNDVPLFLFEEIYHTCIDLTAMYQKGDGKLTNENAYWVKEMIAWALPISILGKDVEICHDLQTPLDRATNKSSADDDVDACLIHYVNSFKPWFDKHNFFENDENPYKAILAIEVDNPLVRHMKSLAKVFV